MREARVTRRRKRPPDATAADPLALPDADLTAFQAEAARLLAEFAAEPPPDWRTPLGEFTEAELEAELARRRE